MSEYRIWSLDKNYAFGRPGSDGTKAVYDLEVVSGDELTIFDLLSRAVASMQARENSIVVQIDLPNQSRSTTAFFYREGDEAEFLNGAIMARITRYVE